ncbi:amidase family protein [Halobellus sp. GM3]|uniref:amidase family protein n=1 Tax=Halobellus sp. GM3 TaxID=3458410 RepID=UPI00403E0871
MDERIAYASSSELLAQIGRGQCTPSDVVDAHLQNIEARNPRLNAYVTVLDDEARTEAKRLERAVQNGETPGPLHGVSVAVKDLSAFKAGCRHTFGSELFADHVPEEDSIVVERFERAGAIVLGKTNTPEFGHKGTTENSLFGRTANPFALERTAGGSSGGTAAAVAAGLATVGQGSDAAGSVRIPASACSLVGLKPSPGRIPTRSRPNAFEGITPFVDLGPITRTVEDAARVLDVVSGPHADDPMSLPAPSDRFIDAKSDSIRDLSIAYSRTLDGLFPIDSQVSDVVEARIDDLEDAGARTVAVDPPIGISYERLNEAFTTGLEVRTASRYRQFRDEFDIDLLAEDSVSDPIQARIEAGMSLSADEVTQANEVRTELYDAVQQTLTDHDVIVTPTLSVPPFIDDGSWPFPTAVDGTEIHSHHGWTLTWPFNMTGNPAASYPAGFTAEGLPIGLQVIGQRHDERTVLTIGFALERIHPWHHVYAETIIG